MGTSYESWHHERSEKRLLRLPDAVVSWTNNLRFLKPKTWVCNNSALWTRLYCFFWPLGPKKQIPHLVDLSKLQNHFCYVEEFTEIWLKKYQVIIFERIGSQIFLKIIFLLLSLIFWTSDTAQNVIRIFIMYQILALD